MRIFLFFFTIVIFILSCNTKKSIVYNTANFYLIELTDGVYACIHKIGGKAIANSGIIDNGNETIIFDTFLSPFVIEEVIDIVNKLELSPIKYVVNSHAHNDHIRGNQTFGKNVEIISTTKTAELIKVWEPKQIENEGKFAPPLFAYYDSLLTVYSGDSTDSKYQEILMWRPYYETLANSSKEVKTRLPNVFVDDEKSLRGPVREVLLITKGKGHTESDLVLYLPDDGIIFTGDLVFNKMHPYLGDGFPSDWKNWLDYIVSLNVKKVVPGHGELASNREVVEMKNYICSIEEIAEKIIRENKSKTDVDKIDIPSKYKEWSFDRFFRYNLVFMFDEKSKL